MGGVGTFTGMILFSIWLILDASKAPRTGENPKVKISHSFEGVLEGRFLAKNE